MTDDIILVSTGSGGIIGRALDAESLTVGANTVDRERIILAGTGSGQKAEVIAYAPSGTENAVVTRNIPSGTQAVSASQTGGWTVTASISGSGGGLPVAITGSVINLNNTVWPISGSTDTNSPVIITGSFLATEFASLAGVATGSILIAGLTSNANAQVAIPYVVNSAPPSNAYGIVTRPVGNQTVIGTITATQGTAAASSGGWPVKVTDGTNIVSLVNDGLTPTVYGFTPEGYIPSLAANTALQLSPDYAGNYGLIITGSVEQSKTSNPWTITGSISTPGVIDSGNSSTTILGTNGTFIGTGFDVTPFSATSITIFADQPSITNGLSFQWSSDNSNWDVTEASSVNANSGRGFSISPRGKFFRIVYTNGITAQSIFRLSVSHHVGGSGLISKALKAIINTDNFAETTKAVVTGVDTSNNVQLVSAVNMPPIGTEYGIVARTINDYTPLINQNIQILGQLATLNSKQYLLWGSSGYDGQQSGF